jgi:cutinase-like protein
MRNMGRVLGAAAVAASACLSGAVNAPVASADPCPDVEVVFARGTFEAPGVGFVGQAFVDSLRAKVGGKSVDVYPVNYPASLDFATAADGVVDAANKIRDTANSCPNTKMVLGGYSQGAAVVAYTTVDSIPNGYQLPPGVTGPMAPEVAKHVAAVALFGKPSSGFMQMFQNGAPPIQVGHLYSGKTTDLCIPEDQICSPTGTDMAAHNNYVANGMTDQAADFAASHLGSNGSRA